MKTRQEVIDYLAGCPSREFTWLLTEALMRRPEAGRREAGWEVRLALAMVDRELDDDGNWGHWEVRLVAEPDYSGYDADWSTADGEAYLQRGRCPDCDLGLVSHVVRARCPICHEPTSLN